MLQIYLVRHGLTPWNLEKRFQGSKDISLSEEGIRQAEQTRDRLQDVAFDAIYASSLKRAFETAEIIAEPHGIKVTPLDQLQEICMGVWEGLTWDEIQEQQPEVHRIWVEKPTMAPIPESEGVSKAARRANQAFRELAEKHKDDQQILIVSHGLINACILCQIEEMELDDWYQMRQGNTAVNIIEYDGNKFDLKLVNCTKHCDNSMGIR